MNKFKTITGGSDASAGMGIKPDTGKKTDPVVEVAPNKMSDQQAQKMIEAAMRGAMAALVDVIGDASSGKSIQPTTEASRLDPESVMSDGVIDEQKLSEQMGKAVRQIVMEIQNGNTDYSAPKYNKRPSYETETVQPIPALDRVELYPREAVEINSTLKADEIADNGNIRTSNVSPDLSRAMDPVNIPLTVPNYRHTADADARICATCKYFKRTGNKTGDCYAYNFVAIEDYTCDSWEAVEVKTNGVDSDRTHPIKYPINQPVPNDLPAQYKNISFYPNDVMADTARDGLKYFEEAGRDERALSQVAVAISKQISNKQFIQPEVWRNIYTFFSENQSQYPNWSQGDPLWQQWTAWGGDEGYRLSRKIIMAMNAADEQKMLGQMLNAQTSASTLQGEKATDVSEEAVTSDQLEAEGTAKSLGRRRLKQITQGGRPTHTTMGGEIIDASFSPELGANSGMGVGGVNASENMPTLSKKLGIPKSYPFYLPGERVYSKSLHTLGEVVKSSYVNGSNLYTIKLIDRDGIIQGVAAVHEDDLTPRSVRAMKRMQIKSLRESVEKYISDIVNSLEYICTEHQDYRNNPIKVEDVENIEASIKNVLSSDSLEEASSKMGMRKYVRALQEAEHAMGATTHILRSAEELSNTAENSKDAETIFGYGQRNAYERLCISLSRVKESLLEEVPLKTFA